MKNTQTIKVEQLAFTDGNFRTVEIPANITMNFPQNEDVLEAVFHYGQNHIQPKQTPSVSCGDVIHYEGEQYLIVSVGFSRITGPEYERYKAMDRKDRWKEYETI